jgi:hypothetical protein
MPDGCKVKFLGGDNRQIAIFADIVRLQTASLGSHDLHAVIGESAAAVGSNLPSVQNESMRSEKPLQIGAMMGGVADDFFGIVGFCA